MLPAASMPGVDPTASRRTGGRPVSGAASSRDDHRDGTVDRGVTVIEAQRLRDHPGPEVGVHGQRFPVDGVGVEGGILPRHEGDLGQLLTGGAMLVEVTLGQEPAVAGMADAEWHREFPVTLDARRVVVERRPLPHYRRRPSHLHLVG